MSRTIRRSLPKVALERFTHHVPPPCEEEVRVRFADAHVIVVEKPAGLLSVPGRFVKDCVVARLSYDYPDVAVVHRLDLDTSGLMVFSQSRSATSSLNRQFRERTVEKVYEAMVAGEAPETGEIDAPIRADWANRPRQKIAVDGKPALTRFSRLGFDSASNTSTVELAPVTGRSHKLRLHLAHIG